MKHDSKNYSLAVLIGTTIASFFTAVFIGGCGSIAIGIISLIVSGILFSISFLQLNKMLYAVYGSNFLLLAVSSISNYREDIHDPFALFKIQVHYPLEAHQNVLTVFASICMIVSILCVWEAVGRMFFILSCILSLAAGMGGYLFTHDKVYLAFVLQGLCRLYGSAAVFPSNEVFRI